MHPRTLINHRPRPLSGTTVINTMNLFCTFLHWCKKMKYSDNEVYTLYGCKEPTYGDPFFLTSEERNILYDADLNDCPRLAVIRDIFVFHCYVGCRVGDLSTGSRGPTSRTVSSNTCRRRRRNARRRPSECRCTRRH